MKDLKKYNKVIFYSILSLIVLFFLIVFIKYIGYNTIKFYYITSDLSIKSETQILPKKYDGLQLIKHYFSGPINVKKFKKDLFQMLEIENVYYQNKTCKIMLSNESSSIFMQYPDNIKEILSRATLLSIKNSRIFKNVESVEFFIFGKIKSYSFQLKNKK